MTTFSGKHILVVDDTLANVEILVDTLGDLYTVSVATDGQEALELVHDQVPDLVLLDILMPEMDGYEVCRRIKQDPATRDTLVIFVTSLDDAGDETKGFNLGAVDYITKPFNASVVKARVRTHLELAEARKELTRQNDLLKENLKLREQVEQVTRHDLKNPLQVIMGLAQLINQYLPKDMTKVQEMLQEQLNATFTMLDMINRSLDLYKLERGEYTLKINPIDLLPMLDRILIGGERFIQPMALKVHILVNGRPRQKGDRLEIACDGLLVYTMISNLVANALEASPKNGDVFIRLGENDQPLITIENQGTIPLEIRERFFEKYVTCGKLNGTGLGTYSARLTAEIHGGRIEATCLDQENLTRLKIYWP